MQFRLFFISVVLMSFGGNVFAECSIDNGPPEALANYIRETQEFARNIRSTYPYACTGKVGTATANLDRTLNILDKAKNQVPMMNSLITDFAFNITDAFNGESRSAVTRDSKIFLELERKTLIPALDTLARNCQIENEKASTEMMQKIRYNQELEDYYKNVVLTRVGRDRSNPVKSAIFDAYNKTATALCKNEFSNEDNAKTIIERMQRIGTGIDKSLTDWKQAIALFQGRSNKGNYTDIQKKLLAEELNRQGLGKNAKDQILANFDCYKKETDGKEGIEDIARARAECVKFPVVGYQQLANFLKFRKVSESRTTVEWTLQEQANTKTNTLNLDVLGLYASLQGSLSYEQSDTDALIGNLVNLHASLVSINEALEKRNPIMWQNCMKARPDVKCPR